MPTKLRPGEQTLHVPVQKALRDDVKAEADRAGMDLRDAVADALADWYLKMIHSTVLLSAEPDLTAAHEWLYQFRRAPRAAMGNEDELMLLGILKAAVGWEPEADGVIFVHRQCPDGGTCHHRCGTEMCYRVECCGPLSGVFPNDEWPEG